MEDSDTETLKGYRIVKNTYFLYTRTLVMLMLAMYSSRVTLDMLGVTGYGAYQAIGGCIATLATVNAGISSSISRFITFELGKKDQTSLNKVFTTSFNVLLLLCVLLATLAETAGLWFVDTHMQFSPDTQDLVHLIFQLSLIGYLLGMITMPFMAILMAYEEFKYLASFGAIQAVAQFSLVMCISYLPSDRLAWYAWSVFFTTVAYQAAFVYVCIKRHPQIRYSFSIDKKRFRQILSFASFNYIGSSAGILREQGVSILFNTFFGVIYNAARGISGSVLLAVNSLAGSFTTALSPQITKAYAAGEHKYMWMLVNRGIRFSYYLLFIVAVPVFASTEWLLSLWLKEVPPMAIVFTQLTLVTALCDIISVPLIYLINATGRIALYQCVVGGTLLLTVPLDLVLLYAGFAAESLLWVNIIISFGLFFLRLRMIKRIVSFGIIRFLYGLLPMIMLSTLVGCAVIGGWQLYLPYIGGGFLEESVKLVSSFLLACLGIYAIGITREERLIFRQYIKRRFLSHL